MSYVSTYVTDSGVSVSETKGDSSIPLRFVGDSAEAVAAAIACYLVDFSPLGYSTSISDPKQGEDGKFHASGSRYHSCG